jgi:hypothetical protein
MRDIHTNLTALYQDASEVYDHLRRDQDRDLTNHKISHAAFTLLALGAAWAFTSGWSIAPWLTACAALAFERAAWWGQELSNRNFTMHQLTFQVYGHCSQRKSPL